MSHLPTQKQNPKGLHQRYAIQKIVPASPEYKEQSRIMYDTIIPENPLNRKPFVEPEYMFTDIDKGAEYFVMRLDLGGRDKNHIKACRIGVHAYADAIEKFLPELAQDLRTRYPLL